MQKIMPSLLLISVIGTVSLNAWSQGTIYKCKNADGETIYKKSPCAEEKQLVSTWEEPARVQNKTSVRQRINGHYFLDGSVNGKSLTFLIDTGATIVALPNAVAVAAKIDCKGPRADIQTANGSIKVCPVNVPTLKFGPFQLENVQAVIVPDLDQALLGMNVLKQFNIEQDHGEMRIFER